MELNMNKKGDIGFWVVRLIIALVALLIILLIISQANQANMEFLGWLRDIL